MVSNTELPRTFTHLLEVMAESSQAHHIQSQPLRLCGYVSHEAAAAVTAAAAVAGQVLLPDLCQPCRPAHSSTEEKKHVQ
jgi:hypothetical protein